MMSEQRPAARPFNGTVIQNPSEADSLRGNDLASYAFRRNVWIFETTQMVEIAGHLPERISPAWCKECCIKSPEGVHLR